ncbi:MAG: glycerophosphodiester phosphodiesterase [Acidobacteria bacterium]|nr:glycerophosphodiester phosphodiesterase [Acidobacteriota bacterium]
MSSPLIIAHRGASAYAPENTLAAFQLAAEQGADGLEFDVQLSSDGIPVVIHDADVRRVSGLDKRVADLTARELGQLDVGSWFNAVRGDTKFAGESVPTLAQTLEAAASFRGPIYVELKCGNATYQPLAGAVCDIARDSPLLPRIIIKSFRLAAIPEIRSQLPTVQTAALFAPSIRKVLRKKRFIVAMAREFGAHQLSLHRSLATSKLCRLAADAGMPVTVWTVDAPKWLIRAERQSIQALITNDPARMLAQRDS